jgi:FixJ family two-component response regulator
VSTHDRDHKGIEKHVRIAIVDDDEEILHLLGEVLKRGTYAPDLFSHSPDALVAARSQEYDLVITDLEMPKVSGIELLTGVKQVFPLTQFIMITGYASVKSAAEAMHKGAVSYLTKPLTSAQILAYVDKALERRFLALENQRLILELSSANESLTGKVRELERVNTLLKRTQQELVRAERLAAIGEVVVSINHSVNNSVSAIQAAVRFMKGQGAVVEGAGDALEKIEEECREIEGVIARLKTLKEARPTEYADGINMINLKEDELAPKI